MSAWVDIRESIKKLAPTAAALLGGPFGGLASAAVTAALGLNNADGSPPADPLQAIQTALGNGLNGEQILALKQAEIDLKKHLDDNGIQLEQIATTDRDSARNREIQVKDNTPKVLAYSVTIGFFGTLLALLYGVIPTSVHDVLLVMIGSLGTAWTGIIAYYFGSSAGSKAKTEILASGMK
jgi:hypothetical protein